MAGGDLFLFICVALALFCRARCQSDWSGYVNTLQAPVDFVCPNNLTISGIASDFGYGVVYLEFKGA